MLRLMLEHSLWLHLKVAIDVIILLLLLLPVSADVVVDVFATLPLVEACCACQARTCRCDIYYYLGSKIFGFKQAPTNNH